jgi:hypothetical protein
MEHAVESSDTLLMPGRNEPSITPPACRNLRRLMMPFSNLIEQTIVFLSYTECHKAIANFNFIVQRIIGWPGCQEHRKQDFQMPCSA